MKTSNKLLVGTGICIVLGIFSFAFMMRGAYQKALAAPVLSEEVSIDLKAVKYLNLNFEGNLKFEYAEKYSVSIERVYKDSLVIDYQGDTLNLNGQKLSSITIKCPQMPILNSYTDKIEQKVKEGKTENGYSIDITVDSVQAGRFVANIQQDFSINFYKCELDKIDLKNEIYATCKLDQCNINECKLILPKFSTITLEYSKIKNKNWMIGDSSNVTITGNQSTFLK